MSFRSQTFCFVDELVVYRSDHRTANHDQAKVSWGKCICALFPPDQCVATLLKYKPMREGLNALLGPDPTDERLVAVGMLLQSAWTEAGKVTTLKKMLEAFYKREAPLLRPLNPVTAIESQLKAVLDLIPNFHSSLERGCMRWRYGTTDRGCLSDHCGTQKSASFALRVIRLRPSTFADLERELV